jgi:hypothetical protein
MFAGLNHNLTRDRSIYHVQTEVSGVQPVRIETHVFVDGRVLASKQTCWEALFQEDDASPCWTDELETLMQRQHRAMLKAIQLGRIQVA